MECKNCGNVIGEKDNFCRKCGSKAEEVIKYPIKVYVLCCLSIIFTIVGDIFYYKLLRTGENGLSGLLSVTGLVLAIVAKKKYPKNKFAKVLFWTLVVGYFLLLLILSVFVLCYSIGFLVYTAS